MLECSICRRQFDGRFKVMVPPSNEAFDTIECARRAAALRGVDPEALTPVVLPTLTVAPFESPVPPASSTRRGMAALAALLLAPGQAALAGGVGLAAAGTAASIYLTTRPAVQPTHSVSVTAAAPPQAVPAAEPPPATAKRAVHSPPALAVSRPPDAAARALVVARRVPVAAARNLVSTRPPTHSSAVSTGGGTQLISRPVPVTRHAAAPVTKAKPAPARTRHAGPKPKPRPKPVPKPTSHPPLTLPSSPTGSSTGEDPPTATATRALASVEPGPTTPTPNTKPPVTPPGGTPPPDGSPPPGDGGGGGGGSSGGGGCDHGQQGNGWDDDHHGHHGGHDGDGHHGDDDHGGHGDHDGHGDGNH